MKRLANNRPIVFCASLFALGMVFCVFYAQAPYWFFIALSILLAAAVLSFFIKPFSGLKIEFIVMLVFFILGFSYTKYTIYLYNTDKTFDERSGTAVGTVSDISVSSTGNRRITLTNVEIDGEKVYGNVGFYTESDTFILGDVLSANGTFSFSEFSVSTYSSKSTLNLSAEKVYKIKTSNNIFYSVGNYLKNNIISNVSGDEGGVMVALMLGDTSYVTYDSLSNYRLSGVSHIFAVSGLHVVFFSQVIASFLALLKLKGYKSTLITTCCTVFYAGICGFPVSAVRAVVMSTVLNFVKNAGRKYDVLNSLFLSLIVVLTIFPETLFTYGLILSYLAVLGIALYTRFFEETFSFLPETISSSLSVSFAVTTIMTPVLFKMWGYSSLIVAFLNILLVPIVSILYQLVFYVSVLYAIMPFFGFLWKIPYYVSFFINSALEELNVSSFTIYSEISTFSLILYYIFALIMCDRTNFKRRTKIISGGLCAVILILGMWGVI